MILSHSALSAPTPATMMFLPAFTCLPTGASHCTPVTPSSCFFWVLKSGRVNSPFDSAIHLTSEDSQVDSRVGFIRSSGAYQVLKNGPLPSGLPYLFRPWFIIHVSNLCYPCISHLSGILVRAILSTSGWPSVDSPVPVIFHTIKGICCGDPGKVFYSPNLHWGCHPCCPDEPPWPFNQDIRAMVQQLLSTLCSDTCVNTS